MFHFKEDIIMPRGVKKEIAYTGKAAKLNEKIQKLEADLRNTKEELKAAYKEQLKAEKAALAKENQAKILKAIQESGKTPEEILDMLNNNES